MCFLAVGSLKLHFGEGTPLVNLTLVSIGWYDEGGGLKTLENVIRLCTVLNFF